MCVSWELNPQPLVLLTQCSTTEPQEHNEVLRVMQMNRNDRIYTQYIYTDYMGIIEK